MKAYAVKLGSTLRYAGTGEQARATKLSLLDAAGLGPRDKSCSVEDVEVPTDKPGLLKFLNDLRQELEGSGGET